ncbi:unnamed protein product [Brassica rapa]|uniref:TIR domain-containing protein n=1 Tax=Brassica campestris TaxID=3711 RepID=A0A3P5ZG56_BRACM|nr:unnamed protein product [Brassica rapa]VDC74534.1 unnamed protein product [Brassica rapa]
MDVNSRPFSWTNHQVFVSFRGEELRSGFVSHLVEALQRHGINVFIDKLETIGQDLSNLFARIEESTIALVIFSRRYTESRWCLDEDQGTCRPRLAQGWFLNLFLSQVVEIASKNTFTDFFLLQVIPIFFKVEPVTVKHLRGAFGDKFRDREWEYRCDKPRTNRWKEALASVSSKIGLTFDRKSNESMFVRIIVNEVEKMLQPQVKFAAIPLSGGGQGVVSNAYMDIEYHNSLLRAQLIALREKLHSLHSITTNTGLC